MDFITTDVKTGKREEFGQEIFITHEAESYPSRKRIAPKDRAVFKEMLLCNISHREAAFDTFGKSYEIVIEPSYDRELVAVVKAYVANERLVKKMIVALAEQAITQKDPFLKDGTFDIQEGQLLSIQYWEMPFKAASLEVSKMFPDEKSGFDENEGTFAQWVWVKTLTKANKKRFAELISEIQEYYYAT